MTPTFTGAAPARAPARAANPSGDVPALGEAPRVGEPRWSRPALAAVAVLAGLLTTWGLSRNGYANTYYASAVLSGARDWSAFLLAALDPSGVVSVDKPPLALWMMALSARLFGFSSLSMLLPNALCGVASVLVLHRAVERSLGSRVAILAALALALTPVVVVVSRFNNPDALLMLLLVCSAWAVTRAIESGRTSRVVLGGALVGLAFNTKMLQAYLVAPALSIAFQAAAPGSPRRRLRQLAIGAAAALAISLAWVGAMALLAPSDRPWVGDTTANSWWQLILGANGIARLGALDVPSAGGPRGLLRLFNAQNGGQIAWLLPLAGVGLLVGLATTRRVPRRDPRRAAFLLWGGWALVHFAVFSLALNLFHPYYTSALAPAVAVLAAAGAVSLWDRARRSPASAVGLATALLASATVAFIELRRPAGFVVWLPWVVAGLALVAAGALLVGAAGLRRQRRSPEWGPGRARLAGRVVAGAGIASLLAGPAAYSIATVGHQVGGVDPVAGPAPLISASAGAGARAPLPVAGTISPFGSLSGFGATAGPPTVRDGAPTTTAQMVAYLRARRGGARYLVAASGSQLAAPILLAHGDPVLTMGGFAGSDPAPSVDQLRRVIVSGQVRFVLLEGTVEPTGPSLGGSRVRAQWVGAHCVAASVALGPAPPAPSHLRLFDCAGAR